MDVKLWAQSLLPNKGLLTAVKILNGVKEIWVLMSFFSGLLWWLSGKDSAWNAGAPSLIPGLGRSPGEGNGNPLQDYCLGSPMDRGAWESIVHGITKSQTQLSNWAAAAAKSLQSCLTLCANAEDTSLIPGPGRSLGTVKPRHHSHWSPSAKSRAPQQEKPLLWKARAQQLERSPSSL